MLLHATITKHIALHPHYRLLSVTLSRSTDFRFQFPDSVLRACAPISDCTSPSRIKADGRKERRRRDQIPGGVAVSISARRAEARGPIPAGDAVGVLDSGSAGMGTVANHGGDMTLRAYRKSKTFVYASERRSV